MNPNTRRQLQRRFPVMVMSEDLRRLLREATEPQLDVLGSMLLHYDTDLDRSIAENPGNEAGVAAGVLDAADQMVHDTMTRNPNARDVKCRKGCDHCCHLDVTISRAEAALLVMVAHDEDIAIDQERLRRQLPGVRALPREDRACVFLKDGACSVYEMRPTACRKLLVVSDPDKCDTIKHPGGLQGRLPTPEAEVLWSVLMTRDKGGSMPAMLLEQLAKKGAAHG